MDMENKIKELIAIGASITANCQPCLEYHVAKAISYGCHESEIMEAIEVGKMVRKGSAAKMDKLVLRLDIDNLPYATTPDKECGCGSKKESAK